jgi:hypothetical protein
LFIYDDTALFYPKTDFSPLPPGVDPTEGVVALDWNTLNAAVDDIKDWARGALWYGLASQASDPAPAGVNNYVWMSSGNQLFFHFGGQPGTNIDLGAGGGGGEANTGTNVNTGGVGVFKQKVGVTLQFRGINAGSNKVTVVDDSAVNEIDIDLAEANIVHQNLSGAGSNTHATIDSQLPSANQKTDLGQLDGANQGTIWYASAANRVTRLAPGTAGQVLRTAGAGQNPLWGPALVTLQDEGIGVTNTPHATLNFVGAGVTVADAGGGVATVTISGGATVTLDQAYDAGGSGVGRTVTADSGAVVLNNNASNNNNVLELSKAPSGGQSGHGIQLAMGINATGFGMNIDHNGLDLDGTDAGVRLQNLTAAVAGGGNEQYSPSLVWVGSAHDGTNPRTWSWAAQVRTVNATPDKSRLHFLANDHGGGFASVFNIDELGNATAVGDLAAAGGFRRTSDLLSAAVPADDATSTLTATGTAPDAAGWIVAPRAGSVVELAVHVDVDISSGDGDVWVEKSTDGGDTFADLWGSDASPVITMNSTTNAERATATVAKDTNVFAAGDILRVRFKTENTIGGATTIYCRLGYEC